MKKFIIIYLFLNLLLSINAQQQVYFNERIDNTGGYDKGLSLLSNNNDYVVASIIDDSIHHYFWQLALISIDSLGNKKDVKVYGDTISHHMFGNPGALINFSENKNFVAGNIISPGDNWVNNRGWILCLDNNFDSLWSKTYGESVIPYDTTFVIYQIKKDKFGNLISTGVRLPIDTPSYVWLMNTDSLGNKVWENFYGDNEYYFQGHSVIQTPDLGYAIGAFKFNIGSSSDNDPLVIKTDSLGNEEWRINPGNPNVADNKVMLCHSFDGNIIAGTNYGTEQAGENRWAVTKIMKISPEGEILWNNNYGEPGYDNILLNTVELSNGNIVANGVTSTFFIPNKPAESSWILCLDSLGNKLWYREYTLLNGENSFNDLLDVIETSDNGLIGCGVVIPFVPDTGTTDIWIMKMDSLGCYEAGCDTTVSTSELILYSDLGFNIYPNPVKNTFKIEIEKEKLKVISITIRNSSGKEIITVENPETKNSIEINSTSWLKGLYIATLLTNDNTIVTRKFIVQ